MPGHFRQARIEILKGVRQILDNRIEELQRRGDERHQNQRGVTMPKPGDAAPPIHLQTDTGEEFDLASLKGKNVVLCFYPKADTPG